MILYSSLSANFCNILILLNQGTLVPSFRKLSVQINKIWDIGGASSDIVSLCTAQPAHLHMQF